MPEYTAFKINPRYKGDLFVVDVETYEDGKLLWMDRYETTQLQDPDWPAALVKRKIENREGVKEMPNKITAGEIDLTGLAIGKK